MKELLINNVKYELVKNIGEAYDKDLIPEKLTDFYDDFDYVVGDWAYGKVRLKGFYDSKNKKVKKYNDIKGLDLYIESKCAYGCKWFLIKKIND